MSTDAIDTAASAFDTDMGNAPVSAAAPAAKGPIENMNANLGVLDDDSPVAGGDELPLAAPKVRAAKVVAEEDDDAEDDPEAFMYADEETPTKEKSEDEEEDEDEDDAEKEEEAGDFDFDSIPDTAKIKLKITVDGVEKDEEVTAKELRDGYIRADTFSTRLNQLHEVKQVVQREAQTVLADRQKYIDLLAEAEKDLEALVPAEPDWEALFKTDAPKARALQVDYEKFKTKLTALKTKRTEAETEQAAQQQDQLVQYSHAEAVKFENANSKRWTGTDGAKNKAKDLSSMARTARAAGFSAEETAGVMDSRMLTVLLKASKYDRMMTAAKPKPVQAGKARPSVPGAGRVSTAPRARDRAIAQLNKTGSLDDAAAVFQQIIK